MIEQRRKICSRACWPSACESMPSSVMLPRLFARRLKRDDAAWDDLIAVNLTAPRRCLQLGITAGAKVIVNVADVGATQAWRGFAAYGVSKAGLCS